MSALTVTTVAAGKAKKKGRKKREAHQKVVKIHKHKNQLAFGCHSSLAVVALPQTEKESVAMVIVVACAVVVVDVCCLCRK